MTSWSRVSLVIRKSCQDMHDTLVYAESQSTGETNIRQNDSWSNYLLCLSFSLLKK